MSKTIYTQTVIDPETGEVIPTKWITRKVKNTDVFIRTYIEDIGALAKCSGAEQSVIWCSLKYIDYNTNRLFIDTNRRKEFSECGGISINTVHSAIQRLVKKNILIKESNVSYLLNPSLFFFGTDLEREKVFDLTIRYIVTE